jgi:hypothetical protein
MEGLNRMGMPDSKSKTTICQTYKVLKILNPLNAILSLSKDPIENRKSEFGNLNCPLYATRYKFTLSTVCGEQSRTLEGLAMTSSVCNLLTKMNRTRYKHETAKVLLINDADAILTSIRIGG